MKRRKAQIPKIEPKEKSAKALERRRKKDERREREKKKREEREFFQNNYVGFDEDDGLQHLWQADPMFRNCGCKKYYKLTTGEEVVADYAGPIRKEQERIFVHVGKGTFLRKESCGPRCPNRPMEGFPFCGRF